jgi:Cu+-exporting ATPase
MKHGQDDRSHHGYHARAGRGGGTGGATAQVTDPVCGMNVNPATATESWEYQGTRYYFCCDGCLAMFRADPAKYLAKKTPAAPVAPPHDASGHT